MIARWTAVGALVLAFLSVGAAPASGAGSPLRVTMLTWNVVGLDSNDPTTGPNVYPVGARLCNAGSTTMRGVSAQLVLGSASTLLSPLGPSTLSKGTLTAGRCADAYFAVTVRRTTAAYDATRGLRVVGRATGVAAVSTPSLRELYVERLISQNRNQVLSLSGPSRVYVGETYRFTLVSQTAPGGYEQLESHVNLNPARLELLNVATRYAAPSGATNDSVYADACGWDPVPTSATYLSCVGPARYAGGKAGGQITTTYTVRVRAAGRSVLTGVIYDKSGSSYHYNTDYDTAGNRLVVDAVLPPDLAVTKTHASSPWAPGGTGTWTLTVRNVGGSATVGTTTVTDTVPVGTSVLSASGVGWSCSVDGRTVTCTRTGPLGVGAMSAIRLLVRVAADAPSSLLNTVRVTTPHDPSTGNDVAHDTVAVVRPIAARTEAGQRQPLRLSPLVPQQDAPAQAVGPRRTEQGGPLPLTGAPVLDLLRLGATGVLAGVAFLLVGLPRRRHVAGSGCVPTAQARRAADSSAAAGGLRHRFGSGRRHRR